MDALLLEVKIWSWLGTEILTNNESVLSCLDVKRENVVSNCEEKTSTVSTAEQSYVQASKENDLGNCTDQHLSPCKSHEHQQNQLSASDHPSQKMAIQSSM